jgi:hypothetical protein
MDFNELEKKGIEQESSFDPKSVFKKYQIDLSQKPMNPPIAISLKNSDGKQIIFGTYGNLSLIKGEEKARKSYLKSMIEASCFGGDVERYSDYLDIKSHDLGDRYLVSIDTEQDEYYSWLNSNRVKKMCGFVPRNYKYFYLRELSPQNRIAFVEWLLYESDLKGKVGILILDGYKDFVLDMNNNNECNEFTQKLMKWSSEFKMHISGVMHVNAGTEKAKGFIGSYIQEKAETIVQIRDKGKYSEIHCQRVRGQKFDDFYLTVNDETYLPEIISEPENKITKKKDVPF